MGGLTRQFWLNRRVLVTGHSGFKGGWMSLWLHRLGARVSGLSLPPPTQPCLFEVADVASCVESFEGDIRDLDTVERCLRACRPEIVIHMAAQPLVRRSYSDPVGTYATNIMGTVHVLEAARHSGVSVALNVTSDKCYENQEVIWGYREGDPLGGFDPYSSSKACSELVTSAYRRSFTGSGSPIHIASARAGNVIGGGDWAEDRLIPDCIRALTRQEPIVIRRPHAVRPWQHVLEPLSGYLSYAEQLASGVDNLPASLNFGPSEEDVRSVGEVVAGVTKRWGPDASWRVESSDPLHEAGLLTLDSTLARRRLGWKPAWGLEQALDYTMDWYRQFYAGAQMKPITFDQIGLYENRRAATVAG
jgi:CDP-glucose 4,6-dehydratase